MTKQEIFVIFKEHGFPYVGFQNEHNMYLGEQPYKNVFKIDLINSIIEYVLPDIQQVNEIKFHNKNDILIAINGFKISYKKYLQKIKLKNIKKDFE